MTSSLRCHLLLERPTLASRTVFLCFYSTIFQLTSRVGLNLNFEFESAHELLINLNLNLNSTFAKSMNLNLNFDFSKSMNLNLNLVFSQSMNLNLNLKIKNKSQCRREGGQRGPYPPNCR